TARTRGLSASVVASLTRARSTDSPTGLAITREASRRWTAWRSDRAAPAVPSAHLPHRPTSIPCFPGPEDDEGDFRPRPWGVAVASAWARPPSLPPPEGAVSPSHPHDRAPAAGPAKVRHAAARRGRHLECAAPPSPSRR